MSAVLRLSAVVALLASLPAMALQVDTLQQSGPSANRIDLVILGDGYRSIDQTQLSGDAQTLISALFAVSPFDDYRKLFNVKLVHVISNQNGADNGTYGVDRDTALDTGFGCSGVDRLLCVNTSKALSVAAAEVPEFDIALVVVNDPKYGGSGGTVPVASINALSVDVLRHEFAHSLSRLADEYESAGSLGPCPSTDCVEPNVTTRTSLGQIKWSAWIPASYPVPTPETSSYSDIGLFEGARYQTTGVYRPKYAGCLMRSLGNPFCSVCREAVTLSLWDRVNPIDAHLPANTAPIVVCGGGPDLTFSVTVPQVNANWRYTWTVGGALQAASGPTLTLPRANVAAASTNVSVTVTDTTPFVRNDPDRLLSQTVTWAVQGDTCTPGVCNPASCGAYTCDDAGAACRTQCGSDQHCAAGYVCFAEQCVPPAQPSDPGSTPGDPGTTPADPGAGAASDAGTPAPGTQQGSTGSTPGSADSPANVPGAPLKGSSSCSASGVEPAWAAAALLAFVLRRRSLTGRSRRA